ncbi:putative mitochondrial carrier protein [Lasiodiplodia theobromae]|uniref:Mitochondrial carrier protein PET8 n=2 Tax=Lasiodiplodia TaxID=66739 RepID=A0AA40D4J7_9PEZI|nr:putative mitochondrial carrier protein PET8 [Lasiodiplodia theobromae]KAF9640367.1 putative mitochondrial carrier protein [Lasiodiplodia theobromae]KAK0660034.1 putative mitochondrial carrier protein PET8 [Lasiodiplodia hormozganensis]
MSGNNTTADILLAGAFAAFTVDLLVYPLDTLKTRLQSPDYARLYLNAKTNTINRPALFRGLYQGVGSVIIATLPSSGAFFTTYEGVKAFLTTHNPQLPSHASHLLPQPVIHSIASSVGELVSCAILTPAEVIKQNAQMVDTRAGRGNATVQTLAKFRSNPLALWRGYTALAGRNLPFTALQFPMFERMKEYLKSYRDRTGTRTGSLAESGIITAVSAGSAGSVAAVVTTPIDLIKTRIMLSAAEASKPKLDEAPDALKDAFGNTTKPLQDGPVAAVKNVSGKTGARKSSLAIGREIIAQEGFRGIWRGGALRAVWTMVGSGLYLGVYESGRIWLARRRGEDVNADDLF